MEATPPASLPEFPAVAFASEWAGLEPILRRCLSPRLRDPADLDDVVQETALAAWIHRDQYDGRAPFPRWVYGIALRKAAELFRRRLREAARMRPAGPELPAPPADALAVEPDEHPGWGVLADLPDPDRRLVEMRYLDGRPVGEVAAVLAVAPGTVCSRLCRIRRRLRDRHARRRRCAV
jgi:RNA polymerase sigma-70 factor (ECF subfamily)